MQNQIQLQNKINNRYSYNNYSNIDPSCQIEISYDNWYQNKYHDEIRKLQYGDDLRHQIEENRLRKLYEKRKKKEEDLLEELRIQKEREILDEKAKIEEQKRREELLLRKNENERIINSYSVMSKPRSTKPKSKIIIHINEPKPIVKSYAEQKLSERQESINKFNDEMLNAINKMSNEYNKNINKLNNEINKIRCDNNYFNDDLGKGIRDLNEALEMKKQLEIKHKNYFYKILIDKNTKKKELNDFYKVDKVPYFERKIKSGKNYNLPPILLDYKVSSNDNYVRPLKQYGWYF